ncbi:MAG: hypothetical protein P8010_07190 [Desulfosarcinaceae bacterium]
MRLRKMMIWSGLLLCLAATAAWGAYHHEGEQDAAKFLEVYPAKAGTKLDHCALCHTGGSYHDDRKDRDVVLGSCQWCHYTYGYEATGNVVDTLNQYGKDYFTAGRNAAAITAIDTQDSDGDGYSNADEIAADRFPGNAEDDPSKTPAPAHVYTKAQLQALGAHTEFLLMNTSRSGDYYAEYTGVPVKDLLDDAGITDSAKGITVFAPDGWSQYHPLEETANSGEGDVFYHVYGNMVGQGYQYPPATYYYDTEADEALNPDTGWCDYGADSTAGRSHGSTIAVDGGLKAILAYAREGAPLEPGVLTDENKLDGEGPFRLVVPQKTVGPPDQSSKSDDQDVTWPYDSDLDHNAGSCSRSATIIRVEPLPAGTTDIDILEAGWNYVDQEMIVVYGAIDNPNTDAGGKVITDSDSSSGSGGCFLETLLKE